MKELLPALFEFPEKESKPWEDSNLAKLEKLEMDPKKTKISEREIRQKKRMAKFQEKFKNFDAKNFKPFGAQWWDQTRLKNFENLSKGKGRAPPSNADLKKIESLKMARDGPPGTIEK